MPEKYCTTFWYLPILNIKAKNSRILLFGPPGWSSWGHSPHLGVGPVVVSPAQERGQVQQPGLRLQRGPCSVALLALATLGALPEARSGPWSSLCPDGALQVPWGALSSGAELLVWPGAPGVPASVLRRTWSPEAPAGRGRLPSRSGRVGERAGSVRRAASQTQGSRDLGRCRGGR